MHDLRFSPGDLVKLDQHRAEAYAKGWWGSLVELEPTRNGAKFETSIAAVHRLTIQGHDWYRITVCDTDESPLSSVLIPVEAVDEANEAE